MWHRVASLHRENAIHSLPFGIHPVNHPTDDLLVFDEPDPTDEAPIATAVWKVLLVDDDHDVHATTRLALGNVHIEGRPLSIQSAYSAAQAKEVLSGQDDFALAIVDVVMEDENAGLNLVRQIREELGYHNIRIILRTGQPGYAPEIETIKNLDINDYKTKSELTRTRLFTCITIALRAYALICRLDAGRKGLEQVLTSMQKLASPSGLGNFSAGLVAQLCALLHVPSECMVCAVLEAPGSYPVVLAGGGIYWDWIGMPVNTLPDQRISANLQRTLATRLTTYDDGANLFIASNDERAFAAFIDMPRPLSDVERQLLDVFCSNLSSTLENLQTFEAITALAYTDADMAIPNRNALQRAIDAAETPDCQLVLVDIDHFSAFQDRVDEHFADSVLVSVAIRLSTSFSDRTCVARLGAGLFGVFGPSQEVTLDAIHGLFAAPFTIEEVEPLRLSATLGAARLSDVRAEQPSLFKCAEMALKRAKLVQHGNGVQFDASMLDATRALQQTGKDLQAAVLSEQLCLHYQPFVNLQTGAFTGAEALLRWPDAHGNTTLPERFIPIAEQSGLIIRLGYWVLEKALTWRVGIASLVAASFRVAVNVSPVQLREPDFVRHLEAIIARSGAQASQLELELTDTNAAFDDPVLRARLVALHQLGVSVAIDDYGNGYAALIGLQSLGLKRFKIESSAFASPATNTSESSISKVLMTLASQLKLQSCAEGIESEDQLVRLKAEGCGEGQGNYLCPPLSEAAFADRLNAHSTQH
jgi:diguanylate cyclase (GGDEF)-like protein